MNIQECVSKVESDGYCLLPQILSEEHVERALRLCKEWHERTKGQLAPNLPYLTKNDPYVWNPQNKDFFFLEMMFGSPEVEQILMHFLNDRWFKQIPQDRPNYILRNLLARSSNKALPMHIDSLVPYIGSHVIVMQVSMILEDQTVENGCTVVVPGSHKTGEYVSQEAFESAVPLETRAGDVVIWDSRTWHGALENKVGGTRWALIATYCRWWLKQMFAVTQNLPQEFYERLTDSQKAVMGFCSIPYNDETEGIDMKRGYDTLRAVVSDYRRFPTAATGAMRDV